MVGIMISIIPDGMAVDKMEETEEGSTCPLPTQDEDLNAENREMAIEDHNYREPNTGSSYNSNEVCGTCSAYNQTDEMLECIDSLGDHFRHFIEDLLAPPCDRHVEGVVGSGTGRLVVPGLYRGQQRLVRCRKTKIHDHCGAAR